MFKLFSYWKPLPLLIYNLSLSVGYHAKTGSKSPCLISIFELRRFSGLSCNESRTRTGTGFVASAETAHLLASSDNGKCNAVVLSGLVKLTTLASSRFFHLKGLHTDFSSHLLNVEHLTPTSSAPELFTHFRASHPLTGSTVAWPARKLHSLLSHS